MSSLRSHFPENRPVLILAPMQNVTHLAFWNVTHHYGGPDIYFTEYFRVHSASVPEKHILACLKNNPSARPAIAQMIGQRLPDLVRTAEALVDSGAVAIDLNVGCPAPIVCRKSSGGGLLRHLDRLENILQTLRKTLPIPFTVKTRIGFHEESEFDRILDVYRQISIDMLTVHGRTVKEMYRSHVHYDRIRQAVETMPCPVIANGNVLSADGARDIAASTGAAGLMIGRGAIRNPWIWDQIRELYEHGRVATRPTLRDLLEYISRLYRETYTPGISEKAHVAYMKKAMNFIAQSIDPEDHFLHQIRRATSEKDFFAICDHFLNSDAPFEPEPDSGSLINAGSPRTDCYS
jgi:tRNA-dihydrouridine synthase B